MYLLWTWVLSFGWDSYPVWGPAVECSPKYDGIWRSLRCQSGVWPKRKRKWRLYIFRWPVITYGLKVITVTRGSQDQSAGTSQVLVTVRLTTVLGEIKELVNGIVILFKIIIPRARLGYEMIDLIDIYDRDDRWGAYKRRVGYNHLISNKH